MTARSDAIISIAIDDIIAQASRRAINRAVVRDLAGSIREIGLQTPIMVRNVEGEELYVLVSGGHRIEAYRELGIERIPARIVEFDDLRAELWEIDENLCRAELSPTDRAEQTDRRKKLFELIHGKATENRAKAAAGARWDEDDAKRKLCAKHTFEDDTAKATGKSKRAIQLDAERGEKISPEAMGLIKGTRLDKGNYLDELKRVPKERQATKVKKDLAAPKPAPNSKPAPKPVSVLMSAWLLSSESERAAFLEEIGAAKPSHQRSMVGQQTLNEIQDSDLEMVFDEMMLKIASPERVIRLALSRMATVEAEHLVAKLALEML